MSSQRAADPAVMGSRRRLWQIFGPAWAWPKDRVTWPIVGLALQKNYISLYTSVIKDGAPITERHKGALGELRSGRGNFSFVTFAQLSASGVIALLNDIDSTLRQDPIGALEYSTYRIVSSSAAAR
jgi:hypothetical protein